MIVTDIRLGFRFLPTKQEILTYYLPLAIEGRHVVNNQISYKEIYGKDREPWNLFDKDAKGSHWVVTKLQKMSENRKKRTAGSGCWSGQCSKEVKDAHGLLLGLDKYFVYESNDKSRNRKNGNWIMHEYSIKDHEDYVICEIRNKDAVSRSPVDSERANKKRKHLEIHHEDTFVPVPNASPKKVCGESSTALIGYDPPVPISFAGNGEVVNPQESQYPNGLQQSMSATIGGYDSFFPGFEYQPFNFASEVLNPQETEDPSYGLQQSMSYDSLFGFEEVMNINLDDLLNELDNDR